MQLGRTIEGFETFIALTRDGSSEIRNWTYVRKDGNHVHVSLAVSSIRNEVGDIAGFLGVALDVSKQLAAETALIQLNQQLDKRVQERTRALQTSTEQLQFTLDNLHQTQHQNEYPIFRPNSLPRTAVPFPTVPSTAASHPRRNSCLRSGPRSSHSVQGWAGCWSCCCLSASAFHACAVQPQPAS